MKVDNIFDNKCYIMFPQTYTDDGIYIYEVLVDVVYTNHKLNYTIYTLRICNCQFNCQFNIIIFDDASRGSIEKAHCRKACMFKNDSCINQIGECDIVFAFSKNAILKHYENKLCEIHEQLHVRSKQLDESIKAIEKQKHILHTNPEKIFKNI